MNIKLVLNQDIHKVSTKPKSYQELLDVIARTFKEKLPSAFDIKYKDCEDDLIIIQDEDGFKLAHDSFIEEKMTFMKIFIIPTKQEQSELKSYKSDSIKDQISQVSIPIEKSKSEPGKNDNSSMEKKGFDIFDNNRPSSGIPFENKINNFLLSDDFSSSTNTNRMAITKEDPKEKIPFETQHQQAKLFTQSTGSINTPGIFDEDLDKILFNRSIPNILESNETPDLDALALEDNKTIQKTNKAFEIFEKEATANDISKERKKSAENLDKLDISFPTSTSSKENKEIISPLKPSINVFVPLETLKELKEEESIIEEKSSESQSKEEDEEMKPFPFKNNQILDALETESIPKILCLRCLRCGGSGITKKKGTCSKCVKGFVKVDKKLSKLINHVLTYKLTTKYKKLLEMDEDIAKGSLSITEEKEKDRVLPHTQLETSSKLDDLDPRLTAIESFLCHGCSKEYGPEEIRYKTLEGDIFLCEKCDADCVLGVLDLIKIRPLAQIQAALNPGSCNIKTKCLLRKSETLSVTTNSENWGSTSVSLPGKGNEIKAKLIGNPPSITTTPDSKIFQFIEVMNSGNVKWPNFVFLICVSGEFVEDFKDVPSLEKGAKHEIRLELESPSKVGKYYSAWRLSYTQEGEEKKFFGPRISFEINVESNENKKGGVKKPKETLKGSISASTKASTIQNNSSTASDFRIYNDCDKGMLDKAKALQKMLPNHDVSYYIEYLRNSKYRDKPVEEIIGNFLP